ncbi:sphinganine kinase lcb4 [Linnemannia exigua]|uniref:Sphinganine kinase lcb4 n=1 Tax=Linnemannia exigua TaxID=604196 RepID=A0AAD4D8W1_9FUNG|nr:sphinganine kinase lcb4 [Linnemannia exigua]
MASFPFILQVQQGQHQVELSYNGQHLEFDGADFDEPKQSSGCLPCGPSSATAAGRRTIKTVEILNVTIEDGNSLVVAVASPKNGPTKESVLERLLFQVKDMPNAVQWQTNVLAHVYKDIKRGRHFKVLINPFGGQGHAKRLWENTAEPVFKAAGCTYDLTYTTHRYHAKEIAKDLNIRLYDAVLCVSGDGVLHEVINGLMERPDAVIAHKLPVGPIPGGSGNALSFSLLGEDHGNHVTNAVLGIIKGRAMPVDLCSVTQGKERYFSFVLQSFGLVADVDLGTEDMRWMGEARFTVSALGKLLSQKTYPCEISYIPVETNADKLRSAYNHHYNQPVVWADQTHDELDQAHPTIVDQFGGINAPLQSSDGWVTENDEVITAVGGKLPWASKGMMLNPASSPNDGLVDLLIFPKGTGRINGMQIMIGTDTGEHIYHEKVRYMKVKAFRLSPKGPSGYISIDGEHTPWAPYQVEAHRGLISVLSVDGRYARSMRE